MSQSLASATQASLHRTSLQKCLNRTAFCVASQIVSETETMSTKEVCKSIRDFPRSDKLNEMISRSCWKASESGWRPFQSAEEASILQGETIVVRGCNWVLDIVLLGDASGVFRHRLTYTNDLSHTKEVSYDDLFLHTKVAKGNIPCGMPITSADA